MDLTELAETGQNQPWQVEATNLCFNHANAIAELVDVGRNAGITYWPSFAGYCICTAASVHIHGAHYVSSREDDIFAKSSEYLSAEMAQLSELRLIWAGVQHQLDILQIAYSCHSQLVQSLAYSPMRFSSVFQMEDFFERYSGSGIDGAHITFADVAIENLQEAPSHAHNLSSVTTSPPSHRQLDLSSLYEPVVPSQYQAQSTLNPVQPKLKRRRTTNEFPSPYPTPSAEAQQNPLERTYSEEPLEDAPPQSHTPAKQTEEHQVQAPDQDLHSLQNSSLSRVASTPTFAFSPAPQSANTYYHDPFYGAEQRTPGGLSVGGGSTQAEPDDPFLSFLEQLAQNDSSGGPTDLSFFLDKQDSVFGDIL